MRNTHCNTIISRIGSEILLKKFKGSDGEKVKASGMKRRLMICSNYETISLINSHSLCIDRYYYFFIVRGILLIWEVVGEDGAAA